MENAKTILVIDKNYDMQEQYRELLRETPYLLAGTASDGSTGLSMIRNLEPDLVIMEMILPQMDGFELLEHLQRDNSLRKRPVILIVTVTSVDAFIEKAFRLGADYYMLKPVNKASFLRRISSLIKEGHRQAESPYTRSYSPRNDFESQDLEEVITELLRNIGVPPHVKGYQFIRDAAMIVTEKPSAINSITKVLYPTIAKMNNTTPTGVERSIRHAIEITFRREDAPYRDKLFSYAVSDGRKHPGSSEFIAVISDRARMIMTRRRPQQ